MHKIVGEDIKWIPVYCDSHFGDCGVGMCLLRNKWWVNLHSTRAFFVIMKLEDLVPILVAASNNLPVSNIPVICYTTMRSKVLEHSCPPGPRRTKISGLITQNLQLCVDPTDASSNLVSVELGLVSSLLQMLMSVVEGTYVGIKSASDLQI